MLISSSFARSIFWVESHGATGTRIQRKLGLTSSSVLSGLGLWVGRVLSDGFCKDRHTVSGAGFSSLHRGAYSHCLEIYENRIDNAVDEKYLTKELLILDSNIQNLFHYFVCLD